MRDEIKFVVGFTVGLIVIVSLIVFGNGVFDQDHSCKRPMKRIEVLYPVHEIGCWLGEPLFKED